MTMTMAACSSSRSEFHVESAQIGDMHAAAGVIDDIDRDRGREHPVTTSQRDEVAAAKWDHSRMVPFGSTRRLVDQTFVPASTAEQPFGALLAEIGFSKRSLGRSFLNRWDAGETCHL